MHGLNPPQRQAVLHVEGPLLVLAGAGSGKTRVIVEKIAHLIASGRMPARRIAAITFTNKSAREMRERVAKRIKGDAGEGLTICTFHALGLKILQIEHAKLGLKRGFSIFDSEDSSAQLKDLLPPGSKPDVIDAAKNLISRAKNAGLSPQQAADAAQSVREREAAALYARYQQRLTTFNAVDFDDLIRLPVQLLESDEECVAALARAHRLPARRRMPGHQRRAVPPAEGAGRPERPVHLRRRRRPVDLRLARRQSRQPAAARQRLPGAADRQARAELPLQQPRAARGECVDRQQSARAPEDAVERAGRRRAPAHLGVQGRRARGGKGRRPDPFPEPVAAGAVERLLHPVPRQPPVARAGEGAAAAARAVPPDRRHRVPRSRRSEGRDGVVAAGRQSRRRRRVPARGHLAQARGRRHHPGEARRTGAARAPAAVARGRIDRRC